MCPASFSHLASIAPDKIFHACSHLLRLCLRVCVAKIPSMAICPEFCECARQWEVWLALTCESASPAACRWSEYGSMRKQRPGRWLLCCITFPHNTKERLVKQQSPQWCVDNVLRRLASLSCIGTSYLIALEMCCAVENSQNKQMVFCILCHPLQLAASYLPVYLSSSPQTPVWPASLPCSDAAQRVWFVTMYLGAAGHADRRDSLSAHCLGSCAV